MSVFVTNWMRSVARPLFIVCSIATLATFDLVQAEGTVALNSGPVVTKTEILAGKNVAPMLSTQSSAQMRAAEERYAEIAANGGWPAVSKSGLKKGAEGAGVATLNKRLFIEGYLRVEGTQGSFGSIFTTATQDAVARFQRNHGLKISGVVDQQTQKALNVSARDRLQTIRANIARFEIYAGGLGDRYLIVNVPGQQIETVTNGRVYSRHNAIVGRPERPTPVVMTALSEVKFNPYWNAPASIVERDIIPKLKSGTQYLEETNIKVFQGFGGPEIDPSDVDWDSAIADEYHFRQEPGPENAMATAKVEFQSPFGIYLHDTPEKQLFKSGRRLYSSGCVRVEKIDVLLDWVLNGQDGYNDARISAMAETLEQLDVKLTTPPQLRVVYLTAWPVGNTLAFRDDVYDLDETGFTVGQPMPKGETSPDGLRYTLKPLPRMVAQLEDSQGFSFFRRPANASISTNRSDSVTPGFRKASVTNSNERPSFLRKVNGLLVRTFLEPGEKPPVAASNSTASTKKNTKKNKGFFDTIDESEKAEVRKPVEKKKTAKTETVGKTVIVGINDKKTLLAKEKSKSKKIPASPAKNAALKNKPATDKKIVASADTQKATTQKPSTKKTNPVAVECIADKSGKLPKSCAVPAKAKTAATPAAKPAAADPNKPSATN